MSSLLVLVVGISLSVPAAAIAHDERVELHPALLASTTGIVAPQTETCRPLQLAIVLQVTASEALVSGSVLATSGAFGELEVPLSEVLAENKKSVEDLYAQAGDFDPIRHALNLHANAASMSIPTFASIARACLRSGFVAVDIVTTPPPGPRIWTRPVTHQHFCSTTIELVDDGKPLSDFTDWAELVRAADRANGILKVRVR